MYERLFGFKERPFKLVPNPAYLYLSPSHEDALAHLSYAIDQGDGFVLITGEVGTGKTTLCRVFLESLPDTADAAFIFNPRLTPIGLLQTINSEFGLPATSRNAAELTAGLNAFLIQQRKQGRSVLLVVDEAQNLDRRVLEQLRLLSNLETTTSKLIQIILVGQPELGHFLESHELRQLNQRITLSCHLRPLTRSETRGYIEHRLQVAAQRPIAIFRSGAMRAIYDHSGGVPRLVNILCDRALLVAYAHKRQSVSSGMIREAVAEMGTGAVRREGVPIAWRWGIGVAVGLIAVVGIWAFAHRWQDNTSHAKPVVALPVPSITRAAQSTSVTTFEAMLIELESMPSRTVSMASALARWQVLAPIAAPIGRTTNDHRFFRKASAAHGMKLMARQGSLSSLIRLNLPAILPFHKKDGSLAGYGLLDRVEGQQVHLKIAPDRPAVVVSPDRLNSAWKGLAYIPWRDFYGCRGVITEAAPSESVRCLKRLLADIGVSNLPANVAYDPATRAAVMAFQRRYGIDPDGIVGSATKIVLYNALGTLETPGLVTLSQDSAGPKGGLS